MADGYISQIKTPDNKTYLLKDTEKLPLIGGKLTGGLEITGHIAGDSSTTTGHGLYNGGMYHNAYNNIILHGDASTGSSGIAFISDKVSSNGTITNINAPSDRAFIQYHAYGVTTATAEGSAPTIATSGEAGRLVIGIGNDSGDKIILQAPGTTDIIHQMGATGYPIPHTTNTNGTVGGTTTPVYVEAGVIKAGTALGTASQKAESYFVKAVTSTDNTVVRFNGTAGQIQDSGVIIDDNDNITIGSNRIRNQTTVPGQGEILLSAFGFKTGYPLYTDPTFSSGINSVGVYNNSGGGTVIHTRGGYASFEVPSPGTESGVIIKIETTGTASPGCGGFVQSIPARANAQFVQIFRALVPADRKLYTASNTMGTDYKDEWLTSNNGTGKWEWYARRVICGQTGTMSSGGHIYIDGSVPVTWYLASCNVYDITKTQYDGLRVRESDGVVDYNNGTITTFGYSTAGMTSTSWLGSWDGYKLRAISPANAIKSAISTSAIGAENIPIYWNGSSFSAGTALKALAYKDSLTASDVGLGNVENTKLSTWAGSSNITTVGTISTGTWHGTKIANDYIANPKVTIAGNDVSLGGSLAASTLTESLGLSKAMRFIGVAANAITDGGTQDPGISGYSTKTAGDVIIDSGSSREYVWSTTGKWELLGGDSSYKTIQDAVNDPTAATTTSTTFIDTISQNTNGVITATKKTLPTASSSVAGITKVGASGGAAAYSHGTHVTTATVQEALSINTSSGSATKALTEKGTFVTFGTSNLTIGTTSSTAMAGDTVVTNVAISANTTTNANYPIVFATSNKDTTAAKNEGLQKSGAKFYFNPSTGNVQATTFNGYTLAAASAKAVVTSIDTSASLPTSNAVKTFVEEKGYVTSSGVTSITLKAGAGITLDTDNTAITSTGTRTISINGINTTSGSETTCLTAKGTWKTFGTSNLTIGTTSSTAMAGNTTVTNVAISADTTTNKDYAVVFGTTPSDGTTPTAAKTEGLQKNIGKFYFNPSSGSLNATSFCVDEHVNLKWNSTDSVLEFVFA